MGQVEGEKDEDGKERQRVTVTNQGVRRFQEREKMWQVAYQSAFSREIEPKILGDLL